MSGRDVPGGSRPALQITSIPWETFRADSLENVRRFEEGAVRGGGHRLNFEDPARIQRLLTPERVELLQSVMTDPPDSVRGLAARLDRHVNDVHHDVQLLAEYGVLILEETGRAQRPIVPYEEIHIEVRLAPPGDDEGSLPVR